MDIRGNRLWGDETKDKEQEDEGGEGGLSIIIIIACFFIRC
jgi:hypothetical protein